VTFDLEAQQIAAARAQLPALSHAVL
jgi:hypothetical protein